VSRTPAAELARLKLAFPDWLFRRTAVGRAGGFTARRKLPDGGKQSLYGQSLPDLEYQLRLLEKEDRPR
jgi:hypothetical protein